MVGQEPVHRLRSKHSRSRTGCLPCKARHIRCDEQRPHCANCTNARRACKYSPLGLIVKTTATKTRLPGVEAPWQLTPELSASTLDPFDTLPIDMPFRSADLLRFFMQHKGPICSIVAPDRWLDFLSTTKINSYICHSLLLIAAAYYHNRNGGLREYEPAFLYHKVRCIEIVNGWLADATMRLTPQCMSLISTLGSAEACTGDFAAAVEHHLAGLAQILDLRAEHGGDDALPSREMDNEMSQRYIMMSYLTMAVIKSSRTVFQTSDDMLARYLASGMDSCAADQGRHEIDYLRLAPYFFAISAITQSNLVDARAMISRLRWLVAQHSDTAEEWSFDAMVALLRDYKKLHVLSVQSPVPQPNKTAPSVPVSWVSLVAATCFFVYGVLRPSHGDVPLDLRLTLQLARGLASELDAILINPASHANATDLWLWMAVCAAMGLRRMSQTSDHDDITTAMVITQLESTARRQLRAFAELAGSPRWQTGRDILRSVVWPRHCADEQAKIIWDEAFAENATPALPH
ncbi:uncharacterized protein PV09_05770 [Verruconis gallopava]|uniref:Zn(2)-C6 fungal-type domain-containing protein n=1 Tax=Verruconis gallopava TaxID=253628 RepID=A0A0D2A8Q2_9PEZI|nr:uncharacterized protein PV09_05770 [Verruconis gallopava]KIW03128.1 hypothetical protein PV09_05770 [Verruconis gallopava]